MLYQFVYLEVDLKYSNICWRSRYLHFI